jgi:hypothetical protein
MGDRLACPISDGFTKQATNVLAKILFCPLNVGFFFENPVQY